MRRALAAAAKAARAEADPQDREQRTKLLLPVSRTRNPDRGVPRAHLGAVPQCNLDELLDGAGHVDERDRIDPRHQLPAALRTPVAMLWSRYLVYRAEPMRAPDGLDLAAATLRLTLAPSIFSELHTWISFGNWLWPSIQRQLF